MNLRRTYLIGLVLAVSAFAVIVVAAASGAGVSPGKIAYMSKLDGEADIYSMKGDGTGEFNITHDKLIGERVDTEPAWSPNGALVAFERHYAKGSSELMLVRSDGTKLSTLVRGQAGVHNHHPGWAPRGDAVVFSSNRDGNFDLYYLKLSLPGYLQQLTFTKAPTQNMEPQWSPDGRSIVFSQTVTEKAPAGISVLDFSTGKFSALTKPEKGAGDVNPTWSPDGSQIAFASDRAGSEDIYLVSATGGPLKRLTTKLSNDNHPTWAPSGMTLAFVSDATGATEIFSVSLSSFQLTQLTFDKAVKAHPTWQRMTITPSG